MNEPTPEITPITPTELVTSTPLEEITRAEVDIQIATAHKYKRSIEEFKKRAIAMATIDEETAESCMYNLRRFDKKSGETKIISGESIRLAEIVAACYGNLRSAVQIVGHTPTRVKVRAVCHDLETNNAIAIEKQTATIYKDGSPYNEDLAVLVTNATVSKALRDAIFRVVPKALAKPITAAARQVAIGTAATLQARRAKVMAWLAFRKVTPERVWATLGIKGEADLGLEQLEILTGLKTAIMEGDQTVEEAFPGSQQPSSMIHEVAPSSPGPGEGASALSFNAQAQTTQEAQTTQKRVGRPPGSKNKPKASSTPDEQSVAPADSQPELAAIVSTSLAPEPAPPTALSPVAPLAPIQQELQTFILSNGHTFDRLVKFCADSGFEKTADSWSSFEDVPLVSCRNILNARSGILEMLARAAARK